MSATRVIVERIRAAGPITVAEFMEIALYDAQYGYYSSAQRRSGRSGDFFTSVDVGPLFGEMIAAQLDEMWREIRRTPDETCDLLEAGAGNGQLTRDVLDAASARYPRLYTGLRVTLVERSASARRGHAVTLGPHADRLLESRADLPDRITGVILANELLDAMPTHVVAGTLSGLHEIYVTERDGQLVEIEGEVSDERIARQLAQAGVAMGAGARGEVSLAASDWIAGAARRLERGFMLLFDYGHEAADLYSARHASGTLVAYRSHVGGGAWLHDPGRSDLTAHVDFTSIRRAAEEAGLDVLGLVDQTYFLMGLGIPARLEAGDGRHALSRRLEARTLLMPGGLGSTMKAMVLARNVGRPALAGLSSGRLT